MRSTLILILLGGIFVWTSHWYASTATICPVPITYSLGEIDVRFQVGKDELKKVFAAAEALWESNLNQELFIYDESADFKINFIYDDRQHMATTEEEWKLSLDQQEGKNRRLMDEIKELGKSYQTKDEDYKAERSKYESRLEAYNQEVEKYNNQGGAPAEIFKKLQFEQRELSKILAGLTRSENTLNNLASEVNDKGEIANKKIAEYNKEVLEYNDLFGTLETFTQGDFERERINIYKFSDSEELIKVISHEFGHALGISHVELEGSIMYYLMTERDSTSLSVADKEALMAVCGGSSTFPSKVRRGIRTVLSYLK